MSLTNRGLLHRLLYPRAATNENTGTLNRAFFECPECGERWTYECNLIDYVATCPECDTRDVEPYYVEEIESDDHEIY